MATRQPSYSPKQIAEALGVSESSVKRWCDKGTIPTVRTMGGHRRITLEGLQQFLRDSGRRLLIPQALGLPPLPALRRTQVPGDDQPLMKEFRERLAEGDEPACRELLQQFIATGTTFGEAAETLITDAMHGLGDAWQQHQLGVYQERRACEISARLIAELRGRLPPISPSAPVAFGGTPEGDPYQLPTALVELSLREAGWNAMNLGNNLPLGSFQQAVHDQPPQLVWLSVSAIAHLSTFVTEENRLAETLGNDVALFLGGRAISEKVRAKLQYTGYCDDIQQLVKLSEAIAYRHSQ